LPLEVLFHVSGRPACPVLLLVVVVIVIVVVVVVVVVADRAKAASGRGLS
jgi:hypothetical protein